MHNQFETYFSLNIRSSQAIIAGAQGIAFAVPSNTIGWVVQQLLTQGKVTRGYLGVAGFGRPVGDPVLQQVLRRLKISANSVFQVAGLDPSGPGAASGLQPGDMIIMADGVAISNMDDLFRLVASLRQWSQIYINYRLRILCNAGEGYDKL